MDMFKVMVLDLKLEAISPADLLRARIFHSYELLLNLLEPIRLANAAGAATSSQSGKTKGVGNSI